MLRAPCPTPPAIALDRVRAPATSRAAWGPRVPASSHSPQSLRHTPQDYVCAASWKRRRVPRCVPQWLPLLRTASKEQRLWRISQGFPSESRALALAQPGYLDVCARAVGVPSNEELLPVPQIPPRPSCPERPAFPPRLRIQRPASLPPPNKCGRGPGVARRVNRPA